MSGDMGYFVGHLVGDYIFQNDVLAANKTKSTKHCLAHVLTYTLAIWFFTKWPLWALVLTFVTHFLIDRFRFAYRFMAWNGQEDFRDHMGPWSIIVVDNTFHMVQLCFTAALVTRFSH